MNLTQQVIEEKFGCRRCNACCKQPGFVYLKEGEADRMAEYLGMLVYDFTDQFCDVVDRRRLVLKKRSDEVCVFLNEEGCRVHAVKPDQCRDFPSKWRTPASLEYCQGLKELMNSDA